MKRLIQALIFYLLLPWLYVIAWLPFAWIYKLSDICCFFAYHVCRYRRKVVWSNLCQAFPDQEAAAIQKMSKAFYQYLCDLLLEHIKNLCITPAQVAQRCQIANPAVLQQLYAQGRHILLVTGHYGNWEWAGNAVALQTNYALHALYQPLSNPYFDAFLFRMRSRFGRKLIHHHKVLKALLQYDTIPKATAILADQAPIPEHAAVTRFLGQPTYVFKGIEKLAKKLNHAVVYISTQRIKRGFYTMHATLLFENPADVPANMITTTHTQSLEADIRQQPATWLWSHKRWKNRAS